MRQTSILSADKALYQAWDWTPPSREEFPFAVEPPRDPKRLARFFSGREQDIERAVRTLFYGRNVLVRGAWGIGKTAFILTTLQRLHMEAQAVSVRVFPIYGADFRGSDAASLYHAVLFMLAEKFRHRDTQAAKIFERMTGIQTTKSKSATAKFKLGVQIASLGGMEAGGEAGAGETRLVQIENPKYHIDTLLARAGKRKLRVILAIDDLDKVPNPRAVMQMLVDAKALLRNPECNFILTGRPRIAGWEELTLQALDVAGEQIHLTRLPDDDLKHAAREQLNLVRRHARDDFMPFTPEAIERLLVLAYGIPRQFNKYCWKVLHFALSRQHTVIDETAVKTWLDTEREDVTLNIPPPVRSVLRRIYERGGFLMSSREEADDIIEAIGVERLWEAMSYLDQWVRDDWLIPVEEEGRLRLIASPAVERALQAERKRE